MTAHRIVSTANGETKTRFYLTLSQAQQGMSKFKRDRVAEGYGVVVETATDIDMVKGYVCATAQLIPPDSKRCGQC